MYEVAIDNFNQAQSNADTDFARGFWNGYGAAIRMLRESVRHFPVDKPVPQSEVQ